MSLQDVALPKKYKNQKVLFEQDLDAWRKATEEAFNILFLNLTQLRLDCFLSNYDYNNNGTNAISQSLQEQINLLSSGGSPISGTSSSTWTINTSGFSATLSTFGLTDFRTYTFPDSSGQIVLIDATQTLTNKSLTSPVITGTVSGGATYSSITLTTPTIANFSLAVHDHLNAAGGGNLSGNAITSVITGSGNVVKATSPTLAGTIGGTLSWSGLQTFSVGLQVPQGQKIILNGATGSVYFQDSAALQLDTIINNALAWRSTTTQNRTNLDLLPHQDDVFDLGNTGLRFNQVHATTVLFDASGRTFIEVNTSRMSFTYDTGAVALLMFSYNATDVRTHADFLPNTNNALDLGSAAKAFKDVFVTNSITWGTNTNNNITFAANSITINVGTTALLTVFSAAPSATITNIQITAQPAGGGVDSLYNILAGAADSGGAGKRLLLIGN